MALQFGGIGGRRDSIADAQPSHAEQFGKGAGDDDIGARLHKRQHGRTGRIVGQFHIGFIHQQRDARRQRFRKGEKISRLQHHAGRIVGIAQIDHRHVGCGSGPCQRAQIDAQIRRHGDAAIIEPLRHRIEQWLIELQRRQQYGAALAPGEGGTGDDFRTAVTQHHLRSRHAQPLADHRRQSGFRIVGIIPAAARQFGHSLNGGGRRPKRIFVIFQMGNARCRGKAGGIRHHWSDCGGACPRVQSCAGNRCCSRQPQPAPP